MRADPARRRTRFGRWLCRYGLQRLANDLHAAGLPLMTVNAVDHWLAGRALPRIEVVAVIEKLSRGRVRMEHVVAHRGPMRRARVEAATPWRYPPTP
jgi:hypothetical protein